ncbi:hypothetical protein HYX02_02980 [Candidatus Woesearchaeota archaeon]|nr:hypothetical protein [Candidatus Woesearchaeota archaeon]
MKKRLLFLFLVVSFIFISSCAPKEDMKLEKSDDTKIKKTAESKEIPIEKRPQSTDELSDETLKSICQQEEWPLDCNIIPIAQGKEMCKRCKSIFPESSVPKDYQKTWSGASQQESTCSDGAIMFDYPPVNLEKITHIEPMGSLHGEHVAPIDHQYYQNFNNNKPTIEVYAPADGIVKEIQHMGSFKGDRDFEPFDDYRLTIEHTCSISTYFIHIDILSDKLMEVAPEFGKYKSVNVPVKAGEIIGWFDNNVDFNVVDNTITINLIEPESYKYFSQRLHIQDPFNYFNEPLKSQLIAKSLRTAKPEGGFIDYDIDGKLIGTWFRENTNGWNGLNQERYWADHLAIVYDSIDPEHILFSVGTFKGKAQQFGVKGNAPKPDEVDVDTGLIKYELVDYRYYDRDKEWNYKTLVKGLKIKNGNNILGVALLQMLEDRKLKIEVFPDKTDAQVNGFTENAKIYVR